MSVRLSEETWRIIEDEYRRGMTAKVLARRFGCSPSTIHRRSHVEKWRDAPERIATPTREQRIERAADRIEAAVQTFLRGIAN